MPLHVIEEQALGLSDLEGLHTRPDAAHADDDEFAGPSLDAAWVTAGTATNIGAPAWTVGGHALDCNVDAATNTPANNHCSFLLKPLSGSTSGLSLQAALGGGGFHQNNVGLGLAVTDGLADGSNFIAVLGLYTANELYLARFTGTLGLGTNPTRTDFGLLNRAQMFGRLWMRITRTGATENWTLGLSGNGRRYNKFNSSGSDAWANPVNVTPTHGGFACHYLTGRTMQTWAEHFRRIA